MQINASYLVSPLRCFAARRCSRKGVQKNMETVKKVFLKINRFYDTVVPAAGYVVLFCAFIWGIFARYILNASATWAVEVQVGAYLWTVLPAALNARRRNEHVSFSMLHDALKPSGQRVMRIAGNMVIIITYAFLLVPTVNFVVNQTMRSAALRISRTYFFLPIIPLIYGVFLYSIRDVYQDIRDILLEKRGEKEPINSIQQIDKREAYREASERELKGLFGEDAVFSETENRKEKET